MAASSAGRVLVTGASGLLGRRVVAALAERGYAIHGVDRTLPAQWDGAHDFSEAALEDWPDLKKAVAAVDAVVHVAAITDLELAPEAAVFAGNVAATAAIVYAAAEARVRRLVYASSQSALGFSRALSIIPPDYLPVDEAHRCHLTEGYGASKLAGEQICSVASYRFGLPTLSLRLPVIWAPEAFAAHVGKRTGDDIQAAKSLWSYIDVRDAARAVALGLTAELAGSTVLNVSARWPFCKSDINGLIAASFGPVERRSRVAADAPAYAVHKAERDLGFRAAYRWTEAGIAEEP